MKDKGFSTENIYEMLKDGIISLQFSPGELLSISELEREYGVGRPIINEVMTKLESDLLVDKRKGRYVVSSITIDDINEMSQLREALECKACELILSNGGLDASQTKEMREINSRMGNAIRIEDFSRILELDDLFHGRLVDFSGNRNLRIFCEKVRILIARSRWLTLFNPDFRVTCDEHNRIIDCMESGDLEESITSLKTHIALAQESFCRIYNNNNDYEKSYQMLKVLRDN